MASDCKDKRSCRKCFRRHHTSLCPQQQGASGPNDPNDSKPGVFSQVFSSPNTSTSMYVQDKLKTSVLLQTCIAQASSSVECATNTTLVRVLLDSGSQRTYITQQLKERLNLKTESTEQKSIKAFGQATNHMQTVEVVKLCLTNPATKERLVITADVVPLICSPLCNQEVKFAKEHFTHLRDLTLSENLCTDGETLEVHVLIGSDHYWDVVSGETRRGNGGPVAMKTKFAWTISGPVTSVLHSSTHSVNLTSTHVLRVSNNHVRSDYDNELDNKLEKFWNLESIGIDTNTDPVLESFTGTIVYNNNRYEVTLPWKEVHEPLPDNYYQSERRLRSLLLRLKAKRDILKEYDSVIKDQYNKGIIERVYDIDKRDNIHYLPHHCVLRDDKETTKLRVVYDASSKEREGTSLNDCLHAGPSLTPELFDIILRFRLEQTAIIADIEKAFLMVSIQEGDRDFLRFLWVDDPFSEQPQLVTYRFTRVVFGVTCSPFLLNATLRTHVTHYKHEDPKFADLMLRSLYVDDLTTSVRDVETGYQLYVNAKECMSKGGFNLRKWLSNSKELMDRINEEESINKSSLPSNNETQCIEDDETYNRLTVGGLDERDNKTEQKVLGINWNYVNDELVFKFQTHVENAELHEPTRRNVLKVIAGLYDPMGLISPIIIQMKILLQEICKEDYPWDTPLSTELKTRWFKLIADLKSTSEVKLPRCVNLNKGECQFQLAGFCDASTLAYAAVVYLIIKSENNVQVQLLASKTRVAPLKKQTVPRLELLGALILARLINKVSQAINQSIAVSRIRCWTDSMNVLYWIIGRKEWKQFINTRVTEIRQLLPTDVWSHVPGPENPADVPADVPGGQAHQHF